MTIFDVSNREQGNGALPLVINTILHIVYLLLLIAVSLEAIELCSP